MLSRNTSGNYCAQFVFKSEDEYASALFVPPSLIAFELLSKLTKLSRNKAGRHEG